MFTGIDEVDWASLRHAHGSAEDVPAWLRQLASCDAAERHSALDGMYGAVHHQGNVYDSTLACVPFLCSIAVRETVPDRGCIVELLVRLGSESGDARAREAVGAHAEVFVSLLADPDPGVRRAAAGAVVRFVHGPARVLQLLRRRIPVERDERVRLALTEALGLFARRHPAHTAAVDLLTAHSAPPHDPGQRLAALGQLALVAPSDSRPTWCPRPYGCCGTGRPAWIGSRTGRVPTAWWAGYGGCAPRTRRAPGCCAPCTTRSATGPPTGPPCSTGSCAARTRWTGATPCAWRPGCSAAGGATTRVPWP